MSIELLKSISTQKAHKTCYNQGSILHYLGTNHHVIGTGCVPWVELPIQRRLCPIFVSGVGLPDIHEYSAG